MRIDKQTLLNLLSQFEREPEFLMAISKRCLELMPTVYVDAYIEEYYFDYIYPHHYYELRNDVTSKLYRFATSQQVKEFMVNELRASLIVANSLLSGQTKQTKDGWYLKRIIKKEIRNI